MADGSLVAQALRMDAFADDCARALLIVTARQAPPACAAVVIDQAGCAGRAPWRCGEGGTNS